MTNSFNLPRDKKMNIKKLIDTLQEKNDWSLKIVLPNGKTVPDHFHITEVGRVQKNFIDCGGTKREVVSCVLQVWTANDVEHRLKADKLSKILKLAEGIIGEENMPVEIEYGPLVASQYKLAGVEFDDFRKTLMFILDGKITECLATDKCGVSDCC